MKKYSIIMLFALTLSLLLWFVFGVFIPTNKQLKQEFWSGAPVLQKLVIQKTPAEIEGPTPPKGVNPEKWNKEFTYRLTGELKNFKGDAPFVRHKDGSTSIYLMDKPDPIEVGPYREGLDL